jgi:hypothetical protein
MELGRELRVGKLAARDAGRLLRTSAAVSARGNKKPRVRKEPRPLGDSLDSRWELETACYLLRRGRRRGQKQELLCESMIESCRQAAPAVKRSVMVGPRVPPVDPCLHAD